MQESQPSPSPTTYAGKSRGKLILAFGIVSLLLVPLCIVFLFILEDQLANLFKVVTFSFSFLIAPTLGISAWILAHRDLRKIRNGVIPLSAFSTTSRGEILGILGTIVNPIIGFVIGLFVVFSADSVSSPKDQMDLDLGNLAATAYQYRIRPDSVGGGGGSYTGFVIPASRSRSENGIYTATVIHADTIQFYAKWVVDSTSTITVRIGPDGGLINPRIYGGAFQE